MSENALYISLDAAVGQINALRQQASGGQKTKPMTLDALKAQVGGKVVMKDLGSGKQVCMLRTELEKLLSRERHASFNPARGLTHITAPQRGNGRKPGNKPTGSR